MSSLSQLSLQLSKDQAYALVDAVMERDDLALTASAHEDEATGEWVFEATCTAEPDVATFELLARDVLGGDVLFSVEPVDTGVNWVQRSLEGLPPVVAGGFYIHGSHATEPVPSGLIGIRIDAAQAFGTGHHETTTGCLIAIERALKRRRFDAMLDVGTGTGVLAIALAKRTRQPVMATDIDPVAVRTAAENAELNGVGRLVIVREAAGLADRHVTASGPFDLIVANILAGPLVQMAPSIGKAAAPGATVILSGLLDTQVARIVAAYAQQGLRLRHRLTRKHWATLTLERGS